MNKSYHEYMTSISDWYHNICFTKLRKNETHLQGWK